MHKKYLLILPAIIVMVPLIAFFIFKGSRGGQNVSTADPTKTNESIQKPATDTDFNKTQYSLTDPASIWVIVNKQRPIPTDYKPNLVAPNVRLRLNSNDEQMQISQQITEETKQLFEAATNDNVKLVFGSGYRSGNLQKQFYDSYVAKDGTAAADKYSARPGHSEHQTGLAFDVTSIGGTCHLKVCFKDTPEGKWIASNAYKYGFIIRYPEGKDSITGYQYEPWHLRFVGIELAQEVQNSNQTLEEFFNLDPAPNYD